MSGPQPSDRAEVVTNRKTSKGGAPIGDGSDSSQYSIKVECQRNHTRINSHSTLLAMTWGANTDLQICLDFHGCLEYVVGLTELVLL